MFGRYIILANTDKSMINAHSLFWICHSGDYSNAFASSTCIWLCQLINPYPLPSIVTSRTKDSISIESLVVPLTVTVRLPRSCVNAYSVKPKSALKVTVIISVWRNIDFCYNLLNSGINLTIQHVYYMRHSRYLHIYQKRHFFFSASLSSFLHLRFLRMNAAAGNHKNEVYNTKQTMCFINVCVCGCGCGCL